MQTIDGRERLMLLLTGGELGVFTSKTATSLIRYCGDEVVGIIDSRNAGGRTEEVIGCGAGIPIFANAGEAMEKVGANTLVVGVAPVGGGLAAEWRADIITSLEKGLDVLAGLHVMLGEDPEFAAAAEASGARIFDVRKAPEDLPVAQMHALEARAFRVLTVGTDCSSGKMVTALELARLGREAGIDARFVATGQTGIMIAGKGIAVDRVISDFTAGAAERLVLEDADAEMLIIEGQGSLAHPGYSGVTLSLLHGSVPHALIMCHVATRAAVRNFEREVSLMPLPDMISLCEHSAKPVYPSRVVGIALNTIGMSGTQARGAIEMAENETGLPATDVIRFGGARLFEALKEMYHEVSR